MHIATLLNSRQGIDGSTCSSTYINRMALGGNQDDAFKDTRSSAAIQATASIHSSLLSRVLWCLVWELRRTWCGLYLLILSLLTLVLHQMTLAPTLDKRLYWPYRLTLGILTIWFQLNMLGLLRLNLIKKQGLWTQGSFWCPFSCCP